jgi:hypothetical protein
MLQRNSTATELTTGATDALLGFLCIWLTAWIRQPGSGNPWMTDLWSWVFRLLTVSSMLGAIAHGCTLSSALRHVLWQPLYLVLGIDVALFLLAAVADWRGEKTARALVLGAIVTGILFYSLTVILEGDFLVFVLYEAVAMFSALGIYAVLAIRHRTPGAATIAAGIALALVAAALQASSLGFTFIWPFDHNGIFHLLQMPSLWMIACGVRLRSRS